MHTTIVELQNIPIKSQGIPIKMLDAYYDEKTAPMDKIIAEITSSDEFKFVINKDWISESVDIKIFEEKHEYKGIEYSLIMTRKFDIKHTIPYEYDSPIEIVENKPNYEIKFDEELYEILRKHMFTTYYYSYTSQIELQFRSDIDEFFNNKMPKILEQNLMVIDSLKSENENFNKWACKYTE